MAKSQPRSLSNRVVAITGAARGIGRATAETLTRKGAKVAIGDLDLATAEQTAKEIGGDTIALQLDVTDLAEFTSFLDQVEERLGSIDVLINNAGIMPIGPLDQEPDHITAKQIEINLHAVIHGTKQAMQRMKPRGTGHIVNIASMAGKGGIPGGATYCATKHAVVGLSEAAYMELRGTGVEISVVMPGVVDTELAAGLVDTRGIKKSTPQDVADRITEALEYGIVEVYVPKSGGRIFKAVQLLPRAGREKLAKALNADKVLWESDTAKRAAYEQRASASAPHVEEALEAEKETTTA